ncbi:FAD-binding oxidoreductase [Streptococcus suis]|nr:FAD-binding oxidoreductase [Streptococcus suis]
MVSGVEVKKLSIIEDLKNLLSEEQVNTNQEELYDAGADRYRKYEKAKGKLKNPLPTAIVYPNTAEEVSELLVYANSNDINVIPRSGKTATEGGLENWKEFAIVIDTDRMNKIIKIDTYNNQATVQAGVILQDLEDELRKVGYTTGHSPQSKPVAKYGGLVSTRSIGQFSTMYGAIEDMVVGLECVFPDGHISRIKNVPRRAAGPDIRHIVIGNEGTLCFITEVTIKIFKYFPENIKYFGYLVKNMESGIKVLRDVMTEGYRPAVARVYSEEDARQHFDESVYEGKCMMLFSTEGPKHLSEATVKGIEEAVEKNKEGIIKQVDPVAIDKWFNRLNWTQETIDNEVREMIEHDKHDGYTTEISADWEHIAEIYYAVIERVKREFVKKDDLIMLGGHSSHSYLNGTNLYFVYNYNINCEPEDELKVYHHPIQKIIAEEAIKHGGSMCHHHGIGKYRNEWTKDEHGSAYYMLEKLKETFDPNGVMSFGNIYPVQEGIKYQK